MKNYTSSKDLYAVEVKMVVYVQAYSAKDAESTVEEHGAAAVAQAQGHLSTSATKVTSAKDLPADRFWDRPLGSDKRVNRELVGA